MVAAIAEVLQQEGLEDAGDEDYDAFCRQLQQAAQEVIQAVQQADFEQAERAAGEMSKSCSECHELYRS